MFTFFIAAFFSLSTCHCQAPGKWNFGNEGLTNVSVVVQTKNVFACDVQIGQDFGPVSNVNLFTRQIWLPPGEFPLTVFCYKPLGAVGAIRGTIYVNGTIDNSAWKSSSYAYDITCPTNWTVAENSTFSTVRGKLPTASVWLCQNGVAGFVATRMVVISNRSPTARKITIGVAADDAILAANIGPYSFVKNDYWFYAMFFSIYLEPGIFPLWVTALDGGGSGSFASVISIDGIPVSRTGDFGWVATNVTDIFAMNTAMKNISSSPCQSIYDNYVPNQFLHSMGISAAWIWPTESCDMRLQDEKAYFRYDLTVPPRNNASFYTKVDFHFAADDQFALQIGGGSPLITNLPDVDWNNIYTYGIAIKFSLFLPAGSHKLKFSVGNYVQQYTGTFLIGTISANGKLLATTNGNTGYWTTETGQIAKNCNNVNWADIIFREIAGEFPSAQLYFMNRNGTCDSAGGIDQLFYTLNITGPISKFSPTTSSSIFCSQSSLSSSTRIISTPSRIVGPSSSTDLASAISESSKSNTNWESVTSTIKSQPISTSIETVESTLEIQHTSLLEVEPYSKDEASFISQSSKLALVNRNRSRTLPTTQSNAIAANVKDSSRISGFMHYIRDNLVKLLISACALGFSFVLCCVFAFLRISKQTDKAIKTLTDSQEFSQIGAASGSTTMGKTMFGTDMGNSFAIPGYLRVFEDKDFKLSKKLTKGGGGDIYFGQALSSKLREFGDTVIVKEIRQSDEDKALSQAKFYQELSITSYLQHSRNIIRLLGYSENPNTLILKVYQHGSLGTLINLRPVGISKRLSHSFLQDISFGLSAMHAAGFCHSDIKSDNVLIDIDRSNGNYFCVLCDFGITQVITEKVLKVGAFVVANQMGISLWYAAPELFHDMRSNRTILRKFPSDVYSFGVLGMEMLSMGRTQWH